jgi:hypothetical protein
MTRLSALTGALFLCMLAAVVAPTTAQAVNGLHVCATTDHAWAYRMQGSGWTTVIDGQTKRDWVAQGMQRWNTTRGYNGDQVIDVQPWVSGTARHTVDVYLTSNVNNMGEDALGYNHCVDGLDTIEINSLLGSGLGYAYVAGHEFGHSLDQVHVGKATSFDGLIPQIATCLSGDEKGVYSQDDESGLFEKLDTTSPRTGTANPGFERGASYWGTSGGTVSTFTGSGAYAGNGYISFVPSALRQQNLCECCAVRECRRQR